MEYWGIEVKPGKSVSVRPFEDKLLHISQACLGEAKKESKSESVHLYVTANGKKLGLGLLNADKFPQQVFDLVFEKDFELSHNGKNTSVYFHGYLAPYPENDVDEFDSEDSDSEDETLPVVTNVESNGTQSQDKKEKAQVSEKSNDKSYGKQKVKIVEPVKDAKPVGEDDDSDDSDEDDDDLSDGESDSEEDVDEMSEDDSDDEDDSDEEDDVTPKKVESAKKRPAESATKTPGSDKKAKLVTPQKTDGKKGGVHVATPHPSKQTGKTPANNSNQKASAGSHSCNSCNRTFKNEIALSSHNQAKHGVGK